MRVEKVLNLPSGRIFLVRTQDRNLIECTEMQDVSVDGKEHYEVRTSSDPHVIWKHLVPHEDKWLLTVSTQKGCSFSCQFCDVAKLPYQGNLSLDEINSQVELILENTPHVKRSKKVKIGYARMGEPAMNLDDVLDSMNMLYDISESFGRDFEWLPCFNTILPRYAQQNYDVIERVVDCKERDFGGYLHFQISCNSTDEETRKLLFGNADVIGLDKIIQDINKLKITNRTVTLNFIVMEGIEVSVSKLKKMNLDPQKFTVKLIPLNNTNNATSNELKPYANYSNYEKLLALKDEFEKENIPVVVDAIAKCEEAGLCCGQLAQIFSGVDQKI